MIFPRKPARIFAGALTAAAIASLCQVSTSYATGTIGKDDLSGPWAITLIGDTGCGSTSMLATGPLDTTGNSTTTEDFKIITLSPNGSGTAGLTCNNKQNCGWTFAIQVAPDRSVFNLVDISDVENNRLQGTAVHQ